MDDKWMNEIMGRTFRRGCPETLDLIAYFDGRLARPRHQSISRHVAVCHHCAHELHLHNLGFVAEREEINDLPPNPASPLALIKDLFHIAVLQPAAAQTRLRGRPPLNFSGEGWRARLVLMPDRLNPDMRTIRGELLTTADQEEGITAVFVAESGLLMPVTLTGGKKFTLDGVIPGLHRLIIGHNGRQSHLVVEVD